MYNRLGRLWCGVPGPRGRGFPSTRGVVTGVGVRGWVLLAGSCSCRWSGANADRSDRRGFQECGLCLRQWVLAVRRYGLWVLAVRRYGLWVSAARRYGLWVSAARRYGHFMELVFDSLYLWCGCPVLLFQLRLPLWGLPPSCPGRRLLELRLPLWGLPSNCLGRLLLELLLEGEGSCLGRRGGEIDVPGSHGGSEGVPLLHPLPRPGKHSLPVRHLVSDGVHPLLAFSRTSRGRSQAKTTNEIAPTLLVIPHTQFQHSLRRQLFRRNLESELLPPDRVEVVLDHSRLPLASRALVRQQVALDGSVNQAVGVHGGEVPGLIDGHSE